MLIGQNLLPRLLLLLLLLLSLEHSHLHIYLAKPTPMTACLEFKLDFGTMRVPSELDLKSRHRGFMG